MALRARFLTALLFLAACGAAAAQEAAPPLVRQLPQDRAEVLLSYAPVVKKVAPAVVNIYAARTVAVRSPIFESPLVRRFLGEDFNFGIPRERIERSLGSGVIVRPEGVVVTNNHVVGKADVIKVVLADRREFDAKVVLADPRTDLAVLRLEAEGERFPAAALAEEDDAEVGDIVLAIGNPFGIGQTVTAGIVSATARTEVGINDYGFFLQTDAAVNPGNSGGPLVALTGHIIGINTAIYTRTGDTSGIGFAIPASMVRTVLRAALDEGEIVRTWLGLAGQPVNAELAQALGLDRPGGVLVGDLYPDGPAAEAGLRTGDVILEVNGEDVLDDRALRFRIATHPPGDKVTLTVLRDGERLEVPVKLSPLPEVPERRITKLTGPHPFQGVTIANLSPKFADELGLDPMRTGVIVLEVDPRSPAGRVGYVRPGDILVNVQNRRINSVADVVVVAKEPWETWLYRIRRGEQLLDCGVFRNGAVECRRSR
ncbi:MAG: Do family serine endopeptidase [Alphaproteobacteria bacterium]|nr:MAG: Do family serine endopeptidase [Alphaproteobacteria bacterium]